ncbi:MAG: hypothetical protein FJ241_03190 [Nitrospira sp.]|nr:hypothetical protein [Nitrospira sp.]
MKRIKREKIKAAITKASKDLLFLSGINEIEKDFKYADFEGKKSILSLGGIAKGRKVGVGDEREYTKKIVSKRIAKEGLRDG